MSHGKYTTAQNGPYLLFLKIPLMYLSVTKFIFQRMGLMLKKMHNSILHRAQHRRGCHRMLCFIQEIRMLDLQQFLHWFFIFSYRLLVGECAFDWDELFFCCVVFVEVSELWELFNQGVLMKDLLIVGGGLWLVAHILLICDLWIKLANECYFIQV